jgi:hypothetical protein
MDDRERDLAEATEELSETLEALREELREPPRGPLGLPRPPRPAELLRFTERYAIPTVVAVLEASIRTLELLSAALRVADGRPLDAATGRSERRAGQEVLGSIEQAGRDRIAASSRETLRRLDDALAELQSAAAGDPSNPELRRLLEDARELRSEVDERLSEARIDAEGDRGSPETGTDTGGIDVDVDAELASIKEDVDAGGDESAGGDGDSV